MKKYFVLFDGQKEGPFSLTEILELPIKRHTLIWKEGEKEWNEATEIEEIEEMFRFEPPEIPEEVIRETKRRIVNKRIAKIKGYIFPAILSHRRAL